MLLRSLLSQNSLFSSNTLSASINGFTFLSIILPTKVNPYLFSFCSIRPSSRRIFIWAIIALVVPVKESFISSIVAGLSNNIRRALFLFSDRNTVLINSVFMVFTFVMDYCQLYVHSHSDRCSAVSSLFTYITFMCSKSVFTYVKARF